MGKYKFLDEKNIVANHKVTKLSYEDGYGGEQHEIDVRIYPFTVEEKLIVQNDTKDAEKLMKSKNADEVKKGQEMIIEVGLKSALMVFQKDDPEITMEQVKKMPKTWVDEVVYSALEHEGVSREMIKQELAKKDLTQGE